MDVWAGAAGAFIYGVATQSHPGYMGLNEYLVGKPKAWMTPLGARSLMVIFLTVMYVLRVVSMHYLPKKAPSPLAVPSQRKTVVKPAVPRERKSQ